MNRLTVIFLHNLTFLFLYATSISFSLWFYFTITAFILTTQHEWSHSDISIHVYEELWIHPPDQTAYCSPLLSPSLFPFFVQYLTFQVQAESCGLPFRPKSQNKHLSFWKNRGAFFIVKGSLPKFPSLGVDKTPSTNLNLFMFGERQWVTEPSWSSNKAL